MASSFGNDSSDNDKPPPGLYKYESDIYIKILLITILFDIIIQIFWKLFYTDSPKDDLRAFGIHADQWMTAAQDGEEWRRTAEQGTERFMMKWIATEKAGAGLRHAVV